MCAHTCLIMAGRFFNTLLLYDLDYKRVRVLNFVTGLQAKLEPYSITRVTVRALIHSHHARISSRNYAAWTCWMGQSIVFNC